MKKKAIISLILVLAMNLLLLKDIFTANALFMIPDEGEPWPQGEPNVCRNFSDTFIDFEDGMNIQLITSQNPGVKFTTTEGLKWVYGDIRTGNYDVVPYGSQEFVANGNFFGWLGMLGDEGRIDFPQGGASYFSVLVSASDPLFLVAYNVNDTPLDNVFISGNANTGQFTRLTVDAPENEKIAYVVIFSFNSNGHWVIDDICTDALNVPYFSQCDERWKNERYDHIASTVCRYGCALTSTAMILNYYGKAHGFQTNPKELNEWFKNYYLDVNKNGKRDYGEPTGYTRYGNVKWEVIPEYFKDKYGKKIVSFNGRTNFDNREETYSNFRKKTDIVLNNDLRNQYPVILKVPYKPWHFIVATNQFEKNNINTWVINDPGWKGRKDLFNSYNNNYYSMRRFGPRKKDNSIIVIRICSPVEVLVTGPDGKKLGIDSDGKEYNEILEGGYYIEDSLIEEGESIKVIEILEPLNGNYTLNVASTGNGPYIIDYDSYDKFGKWTDSKTFEGDAVFDNENNLGEIFKYELNYSSQSANESDSKCFSDSEIAKNNLYEAGALDFSLEGDGFNISGIQAGWSDGKTIKIKNNENMPLEYQIKTKNLLGNLCSYLTLKAEFNGVIEYDELIFENQDLISGDLPIINTSEENNWIFTLTLPSEAPSGAKNQTCEFDFSFEGWQEDNDILENGFSDTEKVFNTISSVEWTGGGSSQSGIVLNEFLPNPIGADNALMPDGEWVELYNNSDTAINVAGWYLYDSLDSHPLEITTANSDNNGNIADSGETMILPNSWLVVYLDGAYNGWLNNSGSEEVRLYDGLIGSGNLIDFYDYDGRDFHDLTPTPGDENIDDSSGGSGNSIPENKSFARIPDGIGDWYDPIPTPGKSNILEAEFTSQKEITDDFIIIENETEDFSEEDDGGQDNPSLPVDEEEPITKEIIITKKIILGDDEKIIPDDDGDGDDDSDDDKNDKAEKSFSSSNFVDSVQPPAGY